MATIESEEINQGFDLKKGLLSLTTFIKFLWNIKWWIIIFSILGGVSFGLKAYLATPVYEAKITFMVKEDEGSSFGGLVSLLGNIGMGNVSKSKFNLNKVMAIAGSQKIIIGSILDTVEINNRKDLLGNFIIEEYDLVDMWRKKNPRMKGFSRLVNGDSSFIQNQAKKLLYNLIAGEHDDKLFSMGYDKENTIMSLRITSKSEQVSMELVNSIYNKLSVFYIEQSIEKAQKTVDNLESKAVSLERALVGKEYGLASTIDRSLGLYRSTDAVPQQKLNRDVQINTVMYGEVIKNLEAAKFSLQNSIPIFQPIDEPYYPLKKIVPSLMMYTLVGLLLGAFITVGFFYIRSILIE